MTYHCSFLNKDYARRIPCRFLAVVVYLRDDGSREGWCGLHRKAADQLARLRGWVVEPQEFEQLVAA